MKIFLFKNNDTGIEIRTTIKVFCPKGPKIEIVCDISNGFSALNSFYDVKFSKNNVNINLVNNNQTTTLQISDDGPGFPDDIYKTIGGTLHFH